MSGHCFSAFLRRHPYGFAPVVFIFMLSSMWLVIQLLGVFR